MVSVTASRWTVALSGLIGAAGVGLAAAASHAGGEALLRPASSICLAHAPALLALALAGDRLRFAKVAALAMAAGTLLFSGDLVARHFLGTGLFPLAAPTGGLALIASWLLLALGAALPRSG
ncbi:MAG: DUF423 domain-containing protein [Rhizobium sp.]|nr:DUF423 domain-containing protein [Rhizobium sp.]